MRFGVLGTGFWASEVHATALAEHPDAELVGVWGRDLAKATAVGARFDVPGTDDVDALLADVDAVSFALPPDVQAPLAERAAAAGKHLLLEKPIALSVDAADRLVDAVAAAGVASVVFFTNRFRTATSTWLEQSGLPLRVFTASVDEGLNDKAYIVPGLGDAGDRQFGAV